MCHSMCTRAARTAHHVTPTLALVLAGHISQRLLVLSHNMPAERHEENWPQALEGKPPSPSEVHVQNQLRSNAEDAVGGIGGRSDADSGEAAAESAEAKAAEAKAAEEKAAEAKAVEAKAAEAKAVEAKAAEEKAAEAKAVEAKAAEEKAKEALAACKMQSYSEETEGAAEAVVAAWLNHFTNDKSGTKVVDDKGSTMLKVASENGYPKVVRKLLENETLVKFELAARARELDARKQLLKPNEVSVPALTKIFSRVTSTPKDETSSGFTLARRAARRVFISRTPKEYMTDKQSSASKQYEDMQAAESADEWECRQVRCKSCYDLITLYTYIGEEITDAPTLISVIAALHELKWTSMDDIQDHWGEVSKELRKESEVERPLVTKLSEARYNYGSWHKQFVTQAKDENKQPSNAKDKKPLAILFKDETIFCGALGYASLCPVRLCVACLTPHATCTPQ